MIRGNVFRHNIAIDAEYDAFGGGIHLWGTKAVEVTENVFEENIVKSSNRNAFGGGLLILGGSGFGHKMVTGNRFVRNRAQSLNQIRIADAGGLGAWRTSSVTISGNYFSQNTAEGSQSFGGAVKVRESEYRLENNLFIENTALRGGAINVKGIPQSGSERAIVNNTIVNNTALAAGGGGGIYLDATLLPPTLVNSILWGNTNNQIAPPFGTVIYVRYSDIQGGWTGDGNIDADPQFVPGDSLFHLTNTSPCVDSGADSLQINELWYFCPPDDIDGEPRPFGTGVDIGADEFYPVAIEPQPVAKIPGAYILHQNYPNPFNPTTHIGFRIADFGFVSLTIYNVAGEKVVTLVSENLAAGSYEYHWDARGLASGVYFYRLEAGRFKQTRKLLLLK